jgi:hypothetical protein
MDSSAGDLAAEPARARRASGWLRSLTTLVLLLTILPGQVQAQDAREFIEDATGLRIQRVNETPNIDGVLNEEIWLRATVAQDFHQVNPVEFDPPSERTEVYLLYDRDTLFVAEQDLRAIANSSQRTASKLIG